MGLRRSRDRLRIGARREDLGVAEAKVEAEVQGKRKPDCTKDHSMSIVSQHHRSVDPNPKTISASIACSAGPVAPNSPTVLTPPIPHWGPSVVRGGAPRSARHPLGFLCGPSKSYSDLG